MKLSEYYKERMAANPELTRRELVDAVGSATVYAIQHDVPRNFRKNTLQKLAEMWKCSIGDIQACLAETPNPLRKEAEKPEGQAGASIATKAGKHKKDEVDKLMREKPFAPAPDPEEPEPDVDIMFPVEEPAEEPEETLEEFKVRMKDMCLYEFSVCGNLEEAKILIAEAVLKELLGV